MIKLMKFFNGARALVSVVAVLLVSCNSSVRLAVPGTFKEQAAMVHVRGAFSNRMSFDNFSSSRIKRGMHVSYPGWGRGFILENIYLNQIGLQKLEHVRKEKAKFRYTLSDGVGKAEVVGKEFEVTRSNEYKILGAKGLLSGFEQVQRYEYVFSALINLDTTAYAKNWDLLMSNVYDRRKDTVKSIFKAIRPDETGVATNGTDSIFIKPLSVKKTESPTGKEGKLLFRILSGYELSTNAGVIAVIDLVDHNIWFYNELNASERLLVSAISTAIFARKVNDTKW